MDDEQPVYDADAVDPGPLEPQAVRIERRWYPVAAEMEDDDRVLVRWTADGILVWNEPTGEALARVWKPALDRMRGDK